MSQRRVCGEAWGAGCRELGQSEQKIWAWEERSLNAAELPSALKQMVNNLIVYQEENGKDIFSLMTTGDEFSGCKLVWFYLSVCFCSVKRNRDAFFLSWLPIIYLPVHSPAIQRVGLCSSVSGSGCPENARWGWNVVVRIQSVKPLKIHFCITSLSLHAELKLKFMVCFHSA